MNKLVFPSTEKTLNFKVQGIFGTPDDWKTTDEANPGLFSYTVRSFKFDIEKGKICPRELTPKEQRELEEKNKKGGKKQAKKDENSEEELRKQEEEEERKREEEWSKKSPQDLQYRDFEDTFRAPQLKFQNCQKSECLSGKSLIIFQERMNKDQGQWVYLIKGPAVSEDQLAKMKKTKPKTLANANDLNPVVMRCWLDYSALNSETISQTVQRCPLIQVDKTSETSEPNLQKTYIKIKLSLSEPFLKRGDGIEGKNLIADPPEGEVVSDKVKVVKQLKDELRLGVESLAMEYSTLFMKELNLYEDFKNMNYFLLKKNDVIKRKEHFLYDFNVSGKYKILKDRLKKVIVHLCQKYFTEQMGSSKIFTGVSCTSKDQFYSQIYNFLVSHYKQTLKELISEKKQNLRQIEVLSPETNKKNVISALSEEFKETAVENAERIIEEYQILGDVKYGQKFLKSLVEKDPQNCQLKYSYGLYCIKNKLKKAEDVLPFFEEYLSYHKDDMKVRLQYLLLLIASESEDNCKKAWVLLRQLICANPSEKKNISLASFLFKDCLKMENLGDKYFVLAERISLKEAGWAAKDGVHKENPWESQLPSIKSLPLYNESLPDGSKDELWVEILKLFLGMNLFNVVQKILPKINSTKNVIFDVLKLKKLLSESNFEEFETQSKELYQKNKSQQILDLIVNHLLEHPNSETQNFLKINLVKTSGNQQLEALLKLAYYYLKKQEYANSRSCILKYIEKKPQNSGLSWRLLAICELNLGNLSESLDSLKKANLSDVSNSDNWMWLARVYSLKKNYVMCNQCINQYEVVQGKKCAGDSAKQILAQLNKGCSQILCEQKMRVQLIERLNPQEVS